MASLLTEPLFEISGRGPPPNKNFYHFSVTKSNVIWRWWKISLRAVDRYTKPGELKESHQDFLEDTWLQSHYDYLEHLSDSLLLRIIYYLELEDVGQLGRTSRKFNQLCGSEEFWEQAVRRCCNTVSAEIASLALEIGWRSIFFTNKIQLQKLISRRRLREQQEGHVFEPDNKAEEYPRESSEANQTSSSEEEFYPGNTPDLSLGTGSGIESETSSCCDVNLDHKQESDSDSSDFVPDQFLEDIKHFEMETPEQSIAASNGRGDCSIEPNIIESSLLSNNE
uniref:F-box protein 36b n=1 Tax=Echeneis naucrates TaxID=173247 RepID=A0A665U8Q6_ECHNA